jgi:iron-sulfur cluster insertion protein
MKCRINRNATKMIKKLMEEDENKKDKLLRVYVTNQHGSHAHYAMMFDTQKEHDVVVHTDKGIDVLLDGREPFLDGVFIQYFYVGKSGFIITNSSRGNHGDH